jgi:lipid-A-disaccharide synthase
MKSTPLLVLCAGEASGDRLGAGLIHALKQQRPDLNIAGIGGPHMAAAGMDCWHDCRELAVMGLAEVVRHLPRLLKLRKQLRQRIIDTPATLFVGIDAPDFNLPLAAKLKQVGIPTMHYVSPSVWAWRPERVNAIAQSCDELLCLFPFEPHYYRNTGLQCTVVGHPRADEIPLNDERQHQRQRWQSRLSLKPDDYLLTLLPGSRNSERQRLTPVFLAAAQRFQQAIAPQRLVVLSAQADESSRQQLQQTQQTLAPDLHFHVLDQVDDALQLCDLVLAASGTVTLETLFYHRPQVAAYKLNALTYHWVKTFKLMKSPWLTLPNVLAQGALIPEIFQHEAEPERLCQELIDWKTQAQRIEHYQQQARHIHQQLRLNAHERAAQAVHQRLQALL